MERNVKGSGSGGGTCSRPGAADGPGQRRWIRLHSRVGTALTGNRRELPLSMTAGHRWRAVPHRDVEGSPCGWAHPLFEAERAGWGCLGAVGWLGGRDGPTKPASSRAQATTIFWLGLPRPAIRHQRLCRRCWVAPGALDHERVLVALAACELVGDGGPPAGVPGRLDEQAADVAVADLGDLSRGAGARRRSARGGPARRTP
jgi:hypothetical protein